VVNQFKNGGIVEIKPQLTEDDYEDLSDILRSPGWKALKKLRVKMNLNAGHAALNTIKRDVKSGEMTTHHEVGEQLSFIRGQVVGAGMVLTEIDKAKEKATAIRKKKAELKKRMEEKAKKAKEK